MKRSIFFLCSILSGLAGLAQTLPETLQFADAEYRSAQYALAASAYQRALYFGSDSIGPYCLRQLAGCYEGLQDWDRANQYLEKIYYVGWNDSLQASLLLEKSANLLHARNFTSARQELLKIRINTRNTQWKELQVYRGMTCFGLGDYPASEQYFLGAVAGDSLRTREVSQLFVLNRKADRLHPGLARALSLVLPGLGQVYAGDWKDGINSLLLNAAFAGLFYNTVVELSLFDATVSVFPWFLRYYAGGSKRAGAIALQKRNARHAAVFNSLVNLL